MRPIAEKLFHSLIPALPIPFTEDRTIHLESHIRMAEYLRPMPIGGVAVWAHTGRGIYLTERERTDVLTHWRESLPDRALIAGTNSIEMARHAKSLGADALLCHPATALRSLPAQERDEAILEYHHELSRVGLPLILFYLYEAAGGISYSIDVLRKLFKVPGVIGIKIATLDSVIAFQDLSSTIKSEFQSMLVITGEDRFFGYSLMMGADAALIGMGTALTGLQCDTMAAFYNGDMNEFFYRSPFVDRFSMTTFTLPMEGYIGRMLYTLAWLGIVAPEAAFDPWGPSLEIADNNAIGTFLSALPPEWKR